MSQRQRERKPSADAPARSKNLCSSGESTSSVSRSTTGAAPDIAEQIMKFYFDPPRAIMPKAGEINMEGMRTVIALMGEAGELKSALPEAERFVDLAYLRKAGLIP